MAISQDPDPNSLLADELTELETIRESANARAAVRVKRPLAPSTYLLRNAGKTLPLTAVIMFAVLLVAAIIALVNSIPYSVRTIYIYSREMLGIGPRGDPEGTQVVLNRIRRESPVHLNRIMVCRATSTQVNSIVGPWPFVVLGLGQDDIRYYLQRQGVKAIEGRLPKAGEAEALVSRPVALNLGLKIGSNVQGPEVENSYSPLNVKVVGIAETSRWIMLNTIEYQRLHHFPPIDLGLVFADNLKDQNTLDHWAEKRFKGKRTQVFAFFQVDRTTDKMFNTLYQILNVVIGMMVLVITFMMGMLINIYQTQRLVEFGLLQAIGYTRKRLFKRTVQESIVVVIAGWILGTATAFGILNLVKIYVMDPHAYAINTLDPTAFWYTVPIPFAIMVVAFVTVVIRFRQFDPVSIVERRLV